MTDPSRPVSDCVRQHGEHETGDRGQSRHRPQREHALAYGLNTLHGTVIRASGCVTAFRCQSSQPDVRNLAIHAAGSQTIAIPTQSPAAIPTDREYPEDQACQHPLTHAAVMAGLPTQESSLFAATRVSDHGHRFIGLLVRIEPGSERWRSAIACGSGCSDVFEFICGLRCAAGRVQCDCDLIDLVPARHRLPDCARCRGE